jgi:hypothetical protein
MAVSLGWRNVEASSVEPGAVASQSSSIPPAVHDLALRIIESGNHGGLPFAIVDKRVAVVVVYRGDATLAGQATALLGLARGDKSTPGVGERTRNGRLRIGDRTTPAGRFASEPGHDLTGKPLVWIDYDSAFAIHRLHAAPASERRPQRLASTNASDKRISAGCVVVPEAFYTAVVQPLLGRRRGVVYVMPEDQPWQDMWQELLGRAP